MMVGSGAVGADDPVVALVVVEFVSLALTQP